jgi:hypothetical protein
LDSNELKKKVKPTSGMKQCLAFLSKLNLEENPAVLKSCERDIGASLFTYALAMKQQKG